MATKIIKLNNGLSGNSAITYVPVTTTEAIQHSWGTSDKQQLKSYLGELKSAISTVASAELETRNNLTATYIKAGETENKISYNLPNGTYGLITVNNVENATNATNLTAAPTLNTSTAKLTVGGKESAAMKAGANAYGFTKVETTPTANSTNAISSGYVKTLATTVDGKAATGHTHELEIKTKSDYVPTDNTVNVLTYFDKTSVNLGSSSQTFSYTRASVPTQKYVDDTFVTKTTFESFTTTGMRYMGSTGTGTGWVAPEGTSQGDVYIVGKAGHGNLSSEVGDFIVYNGSSWDIWNKNVTKAASFGSNTITSGNIVVADGTAGEVKTQTIAQLGLAKSSDITNMVTSANALAANAIVLGGSNKTVNTTTYYPQTSATAFNATSDTQIPTSKSIANYISDQSYLTAQDHTGKGAANRLAWWTSESYHTAYTGNWGSSTKFAYVASGVLKEGTLPEGNKEGKNIVGASATAIANAAVSTNGSVYLNHIENDSVKSHHKITGSAPISVTATDSGAIISITHSTGAGYKHIPSGGAADQVLKYSSAGTAAWSNLSEGLKYEIYDSIDDFTLDLGESTGSVLLAKTTF